MHEVCLNPPPTPPFPQRPVARSFKPTQAQMSADAQPRARAHTDIMWHSGLTLMNVRPSEGTTDTESDTLGTRTGEETKRKGGEKRERQVEEERRGVERIEREQHFFFSPHNLWIFSTSTGWLCTSGPA